MFSAAHYRLFAIMAFGAMLAACGDREEEPQVVEEVPADTVSEEGTMRDYIDSAVAGGAILMDTTRAPVQRDTI